MKNTIWSCNCSTFENVSQRKFDILLTSQTAKMDDQRLINTFEMLIDQLNKVSITNDMLLEHAKHESRHKVNNELVNSALFGYKFKIYNLGWTPDCYGGHIRFGLSENPLAEVWKKMWNDPASLTEDQAFIADRIKKAIETHVGNMEQFAKNMCDKDGELHMTDYYDIDTLHTFVEEYAYSELFKGFKNKYIDNFNLECNTVTIFFSKSCDDPDEIPIDKVLEIVIPELARIGIKTEHIKAVYFTRLHGHVRDILELYDLVNCREDFRQAMLQELVDDMEKECRKHCKNDIIELSEKLEETDLPFMPNLFNDEEEFEHLIDMLAH